MQYEIKLPVFQGPFDLLLFFIERDELDIKDIPITKIAIDFLGYLRHLEHLNIDVASEFILMAATLMQIKAKMLLPRPDLDLLGNEIDPREELMKHLLEYKKYKSTVETFAELEKGRMLLEQRGNVAQELISISTLNNIESELQDLDLFKLMMSYSKAIQRFNIEASKPVHTVVPYSYTIEVQKEYIMHKVTATNRVSFLEIVHEIPNKIAMIFNFLAILELLQLQKIEVLLGEGYNNFWISLFKLEPATTL